MLDIHTRIKALREGGQVKRAHAKQLHREYTVGTHTYNMLGLLEVLHPSPSLALYRAILWHDVPERWTGDIPTPVKKARPRIKKELKELETDILSQLGGLFVLTEGEEIWMKAIDMTELWLWAREEISMGNSSVIDLHDECLGIIEALFASGRMPSPVGRFVDQEKTRPHRFLSDVPERVFE